MAVIGKTNRLFAGITPVQHIGQITRAGSSNQALFTLRGGTTIVGYRVWGPSVSNAGTSATISIGCNSNETVLLSAYNVSTNGAILAVPSSGLMGQLPSGSSNAPYNIIGRYDEDGNASSSGGPWTVVVETLD